MNDGLFSTVLTPQEQQFGFALMEFKTPNGALASIPERVQAVARMIGPSNRIVKMNLPSGGTTFAHQRYGYSELDRFRDRLDWHSVGMGGYGSAAEAMRIVTSGRSEEGPRIIAVDPENEPSPNE